MSTLATRVQKYYNKGYYTLEQMREMVNPKGLTQSEFEAITDTKF